MIHLGTVSPKRSYRRGIAIFIILAISVIGVVVYFTFSKARITLIPKTETKMVDFTVIIDKNAGGVDFEHNILPGEILTKEITGKKKIESVSTKKIPEFAKGKVTLYNNQAKSQSLVAKSHLLSEGGVYFLTDERAVIPAKGSIEVTVTAEEPGEQGNIPPSRFAIDRLSPSLQKLVYAESTAPMTGGFREVQIVTEEDIRNAFSELQNELEEKFKNEILEGLSEGEEIASEPIHKEILEEKKSVEPGTEASEFEIETKVKFSAFIINSKALFDLGELKLSQNVPENREFIKTREEALTKEIKNIYLADGKAEIRVHTEGEIAYKISAKAFDKSRLVGLNEEEVKNYFSTMSGIKDVRVEFWPFWVKTVPSFKNNITIQVGK